MSTPKRFAAAAAVALTAFTLSAAFDAADARTRGARASVHTQRGTATATSQTTRTRNHRERDVNVTGQNGRTRSTHQEEDWNRREGSYSRDRTTTFNDGSTRDVSVDRQRTGQGEYDVTREVTGRNGETRAQTGQFDVTHTENGRTVNGEISTQNHGEIDVQRDVSRENGVRSANTVATLENGNQINSSSTRTRTENGATYERDTTFADGTTRSVDRERVGNGDGTGQVTRTVTGRDGDTHTQTGEYEIIRTP